MTGKRDFFAAIVIAGVAIGCGDATETDAGTDAGGAADAAMIADAGDAIDAGTVDAGEDASLEDAGEDAMVIIL